MKSLAAFAIIIGCSYAVHAQTDNVGPNGPNGSQGSAESGRAYSNGNIPSPYEQNQNRPDASLRSDDTTYMHQQWNDGSDQTPQTKNSKRAAQNNKSTANNKKKK